MNAGWKRGSFTVEASILMPFLMWIIFVMLCLGLFWHDRSVLSAWRLGTGRQRSGAEI